MHQYLNVHLADSPPAIAVDNSSHKHTYRIIYIKKHCLREFGGGQPAGSFIVDGFNLAQK